MNCVYLHPGIAAPDPRFFVEQVGQRGLRALDLRREAGALRMELYSNQSTDGNQADTRQTRSASSACRWS